MERKPVIKLNKPVIHSTLPKTPEKKNIASQSNVTQSSPDLQTSIRQELTHRARRIAKKRFKKEKQIPRGLYLQYTIYTSINTKNLVLPPHVVKQQELIQMVAQHLFHKNYDKLISSQQTKVFDYLNDSETKTEWLSAKGMKVKREEVVSKNEFIH
jgi:hypothetical protein